MVQGAVCTRELQPDGLRQRIAEVRADSVGKLKPAESTTDRDRDPDPNDPFRRTGLKDLFVFGAHQRSLSGALRTNDRSAVQARAFSLPRGRRRPMVISDKDSYDKEPSIVL